MFVKKNILKNIPIVTDLVIIIIILTYDNPGVSVYWLDFPWPVCLFVGMSVFLSVLQSLAKMKTFYVLQMRMVKVENCQKIILAMLIYLQGL